MWIPTSLLMACLMNKLIPQFTEIVWQYFDDNGRHNLPWRLTTDPYKILVSELMLQQTQVARVIPKYEAFICRWSTAQKLAQAQQSEVLVAWQGLGYNRRARFLHQCAQVIAHEYAGVFPQTRSELEALPGIGPYTAGAILAFAFNLPVMLIETNVRRVYLHHFFPDEREVADADIYPYLEKTLPSHRAREWYAALMDYGSYLKKTEINPNQRSKHYTKQSVFRGSDREIRGAILKALSVRALTLSGLQKEFGQFDARRMEDQLTALQQEGLVFLNKKKYQL